MKNQKTTLSRRTFMGGTAVLAASSMMPKRFTAASDTRPGSKPNSMFNGVQVGIITYSYRSMPGSAEDLLKYITKCGINSIELMGGPAEHFARTFTEKKGNSKSGRNRWISASMDGFKALRKMYNDAGVNIHIIKFGNIGNPGMPDEQIEYYFKVAETLGARGITRELSKQAAKRLGPIADKHKIMIGFHNHTQLKPTEYDGEILSYGKYLGINLDIGHYVAGSNHCPIELIKKHHKRIISLHIKDRKINNGPNMPFGQGDTPIALLLQYMKRNKWTFPADIELEYRVPKGSNAIQEVSKCMKFCKDSLA